jgi:hypothetical protein
VSERPNRADVLLAVLLGGAVMVILGRWPHDLFAADEGLFLYEAKRVLDGDVMYRDFFDVMAPGGVYLIALLFALFGVSMETARLSMAIVHALIAVMVFMICRRLGARRSFAAAAALAHPTLCYSVLPMASPHWLGTLLTLVILRVALWHPRSAFRWCAALGFLSGAMVITQHQKSAAILPCMALLVYLEGRREAARDSIHRLLAFAAGAAAVIVPVGGALLATVGWRPLFDALVYHPFFHYREVNRYSWGHYAKMLPFLYPFAELFRQLPAITLLTLARAASEAVAGTDPARARTLLILTVVGAAAAGSILYNPNYTHLGVIAPIYFVLVTETIDTILRGLERYVAALRIVGFASACALCVYFVQYNEERRQFRQKQYSFSHQTVFGEIDVRTELEIALVATLRERLPTMPSRELFCYTGCSNIYLATDARNPTRFQLLRPGYNRPDQFAEVIDVLERRRVPLVVANRIGIPGGHDDPLWRYLRTRYKPVKYWPTTHAGWLLAERQEYARDLF